MENVIKFAGIPRAVRRPELVIILWKIHPGADEQIALVDLETGKTLELLNEAVAFGKFIKACDMVALP
jgi:hypothetical protein